MRLESVILCILNVIAANGFKVFTINDGYRGVIEEMESRSVEPRVDIKEQWIDLKVDHFNKSDTRTWKMRYYQDLHFWKPGGPIYLFINGEAALSPSFLTTGVVYELAKETEGAMYLSEHRYYGKSQPLNRSYFNIEDMKFLSVSQALADNAELLRTIKINIVYNNSKVVVVGGSYAGNLAAWMRLVYPDIVDAAISSSGPLLAKRDFYEYLEVVSNDYMKFGPPDCLEIIIYMFQRYQLLLLTEDGVKKLKREMNICDNTDMNRLENRQVFFMSQTISFMDKAQYGNTNVIKNHCSVLKDLKDMFKVSDNEYNWRIDENCYDYDFDKMIEEYRKNDDILCWTYQTCTEFGYFQTGSSNKQLFSHTVTAEWYDKFCLSLFGDGFDKNTVVEGIKKINGLYGGKSPNVSKVVFVNGEMDPWSSLGITEGGLLDALVVRIPKSSHCKDLYSNYPDDAEELKHARALIKDQIKTWIGAADNVTAELKKQKNNATYS